MNQIKKWLEFNAQEEMHAQGLEPLFGMLVRELPPVKSTLAVGCGDGTELSFLPGEVVVGLDINPANKAPNVDIGDMHDLSYKDGQFDLVYCRDVLEHAVAPIAAMEEMARVSNKYVCIILPDAHVWTERPEHILIPDDRQLMNWAEKSGLALMKRRGYRWIMNHGYLMIQDWFLFVKI
jgi:2-polyprenyl-3-methyl-5-hydroxy-6-metoxy-1,4-benzoquinol methylase